MNNVARGTPTGGAWTSKAPLPVAISEVGVGQVDGKLYVVGGTERSGAATTLNMRYDPATDNWQERAPLPRALHHVGVAELGGKLYALGGLTEHVHTGPQNLALIYDPQTDRWSELPPLSSPRGSIAVAAFLGTIHIFGGRTAEQVVKMALPGGAETLVGMGTARTHEIYDPVRGTWSQGEPLPGPPRDHMGIAVLDGKIHVFGGRIEDFSNLLDRHDVYDPEANTWTSATAAPSFGGSLHGAGWPHHLCGWRVQAWRPAMHSQRLRRRFRLRSQNRYLGHASAPAAGTSWLWCSDRGGCRLLCGRCAGLRRWGFDESSGFDPSAGA
jgi:N-acetylneuraminic acid mutarotase